MGIVNRVLPSEGFDAGWFEFARSVANGPRGALAGMKANVRDAMALPFDEALAAEARRMVESSTTADHKAAVRAWLAGTDPVFGSTPAPGALGESGGS